MPLEFSHLQTADLSEWKGGNAHLEITEVLARLKELAPLTVSGLESQGRPVPAQYNHRTQEGPHISYLDRLLHRLAEFGLSTRGRQHEHAGNKVRSSVRIWAITGAAATITAIFALALINTPSRQLTIGSCDVKIGDTLAEYTVSAKACRNAGYRPVSIAMYGSAEARRIATVWQTTSKPDWRAETELTLGEYSTLVKKWSSEGYRPTAVSVVDDGKGPPRAAAVFESDSSAWRASHDLSWDTFTNLNREHQREGMILRWVSIYGQAGAPQVAAIWSGNPEGRVWKTTQLLTQGEYTKAFETYKVEDFSPAFVTTSCSRQDFRYFGVFVQHQNDAVWGFHDWETHDFEQFLTEKKSQGYIPRVVQACQTGDLTRFSGVLVRK
jgi:hypothetical protein